jgi:hypothetical protein
MKRRPEGTQDFGKQLVAQGERLKGIDQKIDMHHEQYMHRLDSIDNLLALQNGRIRDSEKTSNTNRGAGIFISALFTILLIVIALIK